MAVSLVMHPPLEVLIRTVKDNLQQQASALYGKFFPYSIADELPAGWRLGTVGEIVEIHDSKRIPLCCYNDDSFLTCLKKSYAKYGKRLKVVDC